MIKRHSNKVFIFFLLAAFMVVKWMPSHAHLNTQHDHGGEQHQHSIEAHTHQPMVFHADQIDSDHPHIDDSKVVDLDHDQSPSNDKKFDSPTLAAFVYCLPSIQSREIGLPDGNTPPPRILHTHPGQPRAPPQIS